MRGAAHEATLAAALRIASIEADHPRPLEAIGEELDTTPTTIRTKLSQLLDETAINDAIDTADLVANPSDYVSYLVRQLDVHDDDTVVTEVTELVDSVTTQGGTNPASKVGQLSTSSSRVPQSMIILSKMSPTLLGGVL